MRKTILAISLVLMAVPHHSANAAGLKISEKYKYYSISGRNAQDFARSMSRKGPYSFQHRRRAWATATRDLTFQLVRKKTRKGCSVKGVNVSLKIIYTLPKLAKSRRVTAREQKKWAKMSRLLKKHELTHGRFYKQLGKRTHRTLMKLKRAKNCRALEARALAIAKKLSAEDSARNDLFDAKDSRNYSRMARIYGS